MAPRTKQTPSTAKQTTRSTGTGRSKLIKVDEDDTDVGSPTTEPTVEPTSPGPDSKTLENDEMRELMDAVHLLRELGLHDVVQLPDIVVCGDQSSGKSSVLDALTGIPFPSHEGMCTRFATSITLRKAEEESFLFKVIPDPKRSHGFEDELTKMRNNIQDLSQLPELIEEVTRIIVPKSGNGLGNFAFAQDVLSITISGPARPNLTVVDLPGLIRATNDQQSKQDILTINQIVDSYIKKPRTIVLAVLQACVDQTNQDITEKIKEYKAEHRTIGIITKPDTLKSGSEQERWWVELAHNRKGINLMGWHFIKNRSSSEIHAKKDRDLSETAFFSRGIWNEVEPEMLGIESLRVFLCDLLFRSMKDVVPMLAEELKKAIFRHKARLETLGSSRPDIKTQRQCLINIVRDFQNLAGNAIKGDYEDSFFQGDRKKPLSNIENARRLKARVAHSNDQFEQQMRRFGAKYNITAIPEDFADLRDDDSTINDLILETPYNKTYGQAQQSYNKSIDWALEVLKHSYGETLPGMISSGLVLGLHKDQTQHWEAIGSAHINNVKDFCFGFCITLLEHVSPKGVNKQLWKSRVLPKLNERVETALEALEDLVRDEKRRVSTHSPSFIALIQDLGGRSNAARFSATLRNIPRVAFDPDPSTPRPDIADIFDEHFIKNHKHKPMEMNRFAAKDALHIEMAYYKGQVESFINNVDNQIIQRHIMRDLVEVMYSDDDILEMTETEIATLTMEPKHILKQRTTAEAMLAKLREGQKKVEEALGGSF